MDKLFQVICGIRIPRAFSVEAFNSAVNYKPNPGDIFVASYPKCGTTWIQRIVLLILRKGKPSNDTNDIFFECPYLELSGVEALNSTPKPLAIKIHLPYHLAPVSKDAKYIYICRYPMDCAVSCYYHLKNRGDFVFDEFIKLFFSGNLYYGDYIDHLMGWYTHKVDPNIHFVTYEDLKRDTRGEILKIAKFIGEEYWEILLKEPNIMDDILHYSSFEYMKKGANETMLKFWNGEIDAGDKTLTVALQKALESNKNRKNSAIPKGNFLRKGIVGDWKNHFSPEQMRYCESKIAEKTLNCDVMSLWQ